MCRLLQAERFVGTELTSLEKVLENDLTSFGKGFSVFETVCRIDECAAAILSISLLAVNVYCHDGHFKRECTATIGGHLLCSAACMHALLCFSTPGVMSMHHSTPVLHAIQ